MTCAACGFHVVPKLGLLQVISDVTVMLGGFGSLVLDGKKLGRSCSLQPPVYLAQLPVMGRSTPSLLFYFCPSLELSEHVMALDNSCGHLQV